MPLRNLTLLFITAVISLMCYGEAERNRYAHILSDSIVKISDNYVEPVDRRVLFEGGLKGMLSQLDPYSGYIPPEELELFQADIEQEFGGIGIEVFWQEERLTVLTPVPGSPAQEAGLLAGDTIVAIDGESTEGFGFLDAIERMRGPVGSEVRVSVIHEGEETPVDITLTRARIRVESVRGDTRTADGRWNFVLQQDPRIGYLRLTGFGDHTAEDLQRALESLAGQVDGLIVDLRGNAGGLLTAAVAACDMFIPADRLIVSTRGRDPRQHEDYNSAQPPLVDRDWPVAVLVNRQSASASEIFAACLQDYGRAEVVGERTWGKGTVQNVIKIEGGRSAIRLTTQTYWRPSGENIHRHLNATEDDQWGVQPRPAFVVRLTEEQYNKLLENRRLRDFPGSLQKPSGDTPAAEDKPAEDKPAEDASVIDPQLQKAIEFIQQKIASRPPFSPAAAPLDSAVFPGTRHSSLAGVRARHHDRKRPLQITGPPRSDDRRLFASGRPDLLANPRTEVRLRPGRSALGLYGDEYLVYLTYASRSCGRAAGLRCTSPHDENGPADDLLA